MGSLIDSLPIFAVYLGTVGFILLSFETGHRIGQFFDSRSDKAVERPQGLMVGGVLAMLTFVLAFTFSMAASRLDERKRNIIDEVNAINSAFLQADLAAEPYRSEIRQLLRDYVELRLEAIQNNSFEQGIAQSIGIHQLLWDQVNQVWQQDPGIPGSLLTQAITRVIEFHERRMESGIRARIPASIWLTLGIISTLTMLTIGSQSGVNRRRDLFQVVPAILAFSALTTLVVDLDRPAQFTQITLSQSATVELLERMEQALE